MNPEKSANSFQLQLGPPAAYFTFATEVVAKLKAQTSTEARFIYLLPVKRAVRQFTQHLIQHSPGGVLADPPVFTFYELLLKLYEDLPNAKKVISPAMSLFLVEEALRKNVDSLGFFKKNSASRRGLVRRVNELITELREYGYEGDELGDRWETEDKRIADFKLLVKEFRLSLGEELIDESGAMHELIEHLSPEFWQARFPAVDTLYMSGYGLFTRPMQLFFEKVRSFCNLKIKLDYLPEKHAGQFPVFEHVHRAYEILSGLQPTTIDSGVAGVWEERLFRNDLPEGQPLQCPGNVLIQPAARRSEEVAFIANYVKRLHLSEGVPLHKIGITFPSLEKYAPLIHQIFPRYGVPYNISTGYQLDQSPLIRSFLLVLEVPLQGYEVSKIQQLLASPFFNPGSVDVAIHEQQLRFLARELRLDNFSGNWQRALQRKLGYLQNSASQAHDDEDDRMRADRDFEAIRQAAAGIQWLLDAFKPLEKNTSAAEFRQIYLDILSKFGMLAWYRDGNEEMSPRESEQEYRAFNRFIKLMDQFSWMVSNVARGREQSIKEFHQYLSLLVAQATYNMREWPNYGLQIMPRLEILSIEPQVLVFGGMLEGQFPRPYTQDVFFHDDERENLGLLATEDLLDQDRYLFYQFLRAAPERLIFTYPKYERDSAQVPSNFLNALADRFAVRWRRQVPSRAFLQNDRGLIEQVAAAIPAGLQSKDLVNLRRWHLLHQNRPYHRQEAALWVERISELEQKKQPDDFGIYEGIIGNNDRIAALLTEKFADSSFSVTRLENFAFCPIRFFFGYLLNLEELPEPESGMTALERGQFVHNTLFRFYRELRENGQTGNPLSQRLRLMAIAQEELNALPFEGLFFDLEKENYLGGAGKTGLLDLYLKTEQAALDQFGFEPAYFELAFGRTGKKTEQDEASTEFPVILHRGSESMKITGKIDRIDVNPDQQAMLIDYKTGGIPGRLPRRVLEGLTLQLPVYGLILEELGKHDRDFPGLQPVLLALSQIRDSKNLGRKLVLADGEAGLPLKSDRSGAVLPNKRICDADGVSLTFHELLEETRNQLFDYRHEILVGKFRHTRYPQDAACASYCQFRRICRKDIRKLEQNG